MRKNTLNSQDRVRGPVKVTEVGHDLEGSGRNIRDHSTKATKMLLIKKVPGGTKLLSNGGATEVRDVRDATRPNQEAQTGFHQFQW